MTTIFLKANLLRTIRLHELPKKLDSCRVRQDEYQAP